MLPILVFDVAETILELAPLAPVFERIFGDRGTLRLWFDDVVLYSQALTVTGAYEDAGKVGVAVLAMLAEIRGVALRAADLEAVKAAAGAATAYPDVAPGLHALREAGFRLVTLSNAPIATCETQLGHAGIRDEFERLFSIDERVRRYKPAREAYLDVASALRVAPSDLWLVSCHAFDVMGALSAGLHAALIRRPGNARFPLGPQPDLVVDDVLALAKALPARLRAGHGPHGNTGS